MARQKRGRGEGSVYFRPDRKVWAATVSLGYADTGRRRRRTVYAPSKAGVLEKLARLQVDAASGTLGEPTRLTVAQFLGHWLETGARPAVREATFVLYEMIIRRHINPHVGGVTLAKLTPAHVQGLLTDTEKAGASPKLRLIVYQVLSGALKQAVLWGMVPRNVCTAVVRPRVPQKPMQVLDGEQARRFLAAAEADQHCALFVLLVSVGLRVGEALGVTWGDLDLKAGTLQIRQQLCEVRGRLWLAEPKTAAARRKIDLPQVTLQALRDHRQRALATGTYGNPMGLVFTDTEAHPVRKSNLRRRSFEPLLRKAGLPRIRLHDLRHTAASLHLAQGTHPRVVQEMLGHSNIGITLATYSHVLPSIQREAAVRMDALLANV
ncbi:MAG: tyrosine-type recombinase/integrase [bacterium]